MNSKYVAGFLILAGAGIIVLGAAGEAARTRQAEQAKRKAFLNEVGTDVAAIHRATDVINGQIERGEIRDMETLRERVLDEVAFQKIAIRESEGM